VFSVAFNQKLGDYAVYILSGVIVWDLLTASVVGAGNSFLSSVQYIRQFNHPIIIYSLRFSLLTIITFLIELIALILWIIMSNPRNLILGFLSLPLTIILYFAIAWPMATIAGYMNAKYRDYPQIMGLIMQALWYISPVFFKREMFLSNYILEKIFIHNPLTHILNLLRAPFIYGNMATSENYMYVICTILILNGISFRVNRKNKAKIIYYLN